MRDDPGADHDRLFVQAGQRPVFDGLRQSRGAHEVGEILGQRMKLKSNFVVAEPRAAFYHTLTHAPIIPLRPTQTHRTGWHHTIALPYPSMLA
jgi:hypothetical protein